MKSVDLPLAETQQKFMAFYQKNLQSIYASLENDRRKNLYDLARNTAIIGIIISITVALFYYDILPISVMDQQWFGIVSSVFVLVAAWLIYKPFMVYNGQTKSRTMNKVLSFWGKFKYYNGRDIIGEDVIKRAELFSYFNKSESDDAFWGNHKDVDINVSEHDLRIKGNRGDTVIFKGVMLMFEFPKKFKGKTVVLNKGRNINFLWNNPLLLLVFGIFMIAPLMTIYYYFTEPGVPVHLLFTMLPLLLPLIIFWIVYKVYRHYHPKKATQKVALEGIPFLRRWQVLTDNQVEARYILTPPLMEKMMEIKRLFHGKHIDFGFFDNKLLIAVHTRKNMFETTSLFVSALSYHKVREVVSQLHGIFSVIDIVSESIKK